MEFVYWLLAALLAVGLLLLAWGILIERVDFRVRFDELQVLPKDSKPIRVLHISDIHLAPWQKRKLNWIAALSDLKPDLIVNTGDNLGHKDAIRPLLNSFTDLLEVPGVFVNGSNDYHSPELRNPFTYLFKPSTPARKSALDTQKLTNSFESSGWLNLNNSSGSLNVQGTRIGFLGLDDPHDGLAEYGGLRGQVSTLGKQDFIIGVAHAPYLQVLSEFHNHGAELVFAGHTHGGQVCLPGDRAIITNCDLPAKHAKGLHKIGTGAGSIYLNVCAGLGTSIYAPVRIFCKPEVRLLTLKAID